MSTALPVASGDQTYVTVHALSAGFLTLPVHLFVSPSEYGERKTVPSLSFLLQHRQADTGKLTRIVFDLGIRKTLDNYPAPIRKHLTTRIPLSTSPDVSESLGYGSLTPQDIDLVILSHVHWDHVGTPSDFTTSNFVVGHGALELLRGGADPTKTGGHSHFEPDLLPQDRTLELADPNPRRDVADAVVNGVNGHGAASQLPNMTWQPFAHFPHAIDVFRDGSLFIIDAPGHLQGHLNLLARTGPTSWVYLAGDACHDRRLLGKEHEIAQWKGEGGQLCCIHVNKAQAEATLEMIAALAETEGGHEVEVVLAHDGEWLSKDGNKMRFWPGSL
jgi:glyoxylase-like metal-dependent hydrolase (beta-lactamase superfamily II)